MECEAAAAGRARRPGRPSPRRGLRGRAALGLAACSLLALLVSPGGPPLVSFVTPRAGAVVGLGGVRLIARVPADGRVRPGSLRVLLNGADVTGELITARNGVVGELHGLLDGANVLRVEVEGASWWSDGRAFPAGGEVRFLARRPLDLDRG